MDDRITAEAQIKALFPLVMYYRDTQQWSKARSCYHPDASKTRIWTSWLNNGTVDEWIDGHIIMAHGGSLKSTHLILPLEVTFNEDVDKGVLISNGNVSVRMVIEGREVDMVSWCRFVNRAVLIGKEWKLVSFEAIYDRDSVVATNGASLPDDLIVIPDGARASFKYVEWMLGQRRLSISRDVPGTDRPESVELVMSEAEKWLSGKQ